MTLTANSRKARRSPTTTNMESSSTNSTEKINPQMLAAETRRLARVKLVDFIRGDTRYSQRYVFSPDLFPDYSRATQRQLVAMIQQVCEAQNSPVSVHQWATEEHDDRVVRRIRFRCAFFRKKKRAGNPAPSCGFQFQICYQAKFGWCMLNGKGHCRHSGHPLANTKPSNTVKESPKVTKNAPKRATTPLSLPTVQTEASSVTSEDDSVPSTCLSCSSEHLLSNDENALVANLDLSHTKVAACPSDSKVTQLYKDFAMDTGMLGEEDFMELDLLDETDVPHTTAISSSCNGLLSKTIHLTETPFPEIPDLEDKCLVTVEALRVYANAHGFAVHVEEYATVDRVDEKTMMVVLHCLESGCSYQAGLLWVVGLKYWHIYCQPDGIFVHGCGRLEGQTPCSAMAATPLNQALDHLVDFLNGEVVCPDESFDFSTTCCWKAAEEKPAVSEHVRKETRKAVAKVAGVDTSASAA